MKKLTNRKYILIPILLSLFSCSLDNSGHKEIKSDEYIGVILARDTSLRVDPYIFSAKIDMLNKGETVKILEKSKSKSWIGSSSNFWYKILYKNSIPGWIYGENIKLIKKSSYSDVNDYMADYWEKEAEEIKNGISGKWWSLNPTGDFTNHCIEINRDGSYKSYEKSDIAQAITGQYNFDFNKNEIVFLKGTTFKKNLNFIKRGDTYFFKTPGSNDVIKFKRIVVK